MSLNLMVDNISPGRNQMKLSILKHKKGSCPLSAEWSQKCLFGKYWAVTLSSTQATSCDWWVRRWPPTQICFTHHCIRAGSHSPASAPRPINQWQRLKHTPFLLEDERGSVLRWLHHTLWTSSLPALNLFFLYSCHYYEFTKKKKKFPQNEVQT